MWWQGSGCRRHGRWVRYLDAGLHRPAHLEKKWALHPQTVGAIFASFLRRRSVGRHGQSALQPIDFGRKTMFARVARARRSIHHALRSVPPVPAQLMVLSRAGPALVWGGALVNLPSRWLPKNAAVHPTAAQ